MQFEMMLVSLVGAHCLLDYAGQGDFMAKAKTRMTPVPGVPWWNVLAAHSSIHGAAVAFITGLWWMFILEAVAHFVTDDAKCRGKISFNADQRIHIECKVLWCLIAFYIA